MIFFVQVSTTDVSGDDDMKRAVKEGAAETYLDDPITAPLVMILLLCAVNERARVLNWARVARRSRDFIIMVVLSMFL